VNAVLEAVTARCKRPLLLYQQLDGLQALRREMRGEFLAESRKHEAAKLLRLIPCIGPIRAARLIALMQTPHRFRSKRLGGAHFDC
jgi:transposase